MQFYALQQNCTKYPLFRVPLIPSTPRSAYPLFRVPLIPCTPYSIPLIPLPLVPLPLDPDTGLYISKSSIQRVELGSEVSFMLMRNWPPKVREDGAHHKHYYSEGSERESLLLRGPGKFL